MSPDTCAAMSAGLWVKLLRQPGEEWTLYRTAEKGELPTVDDDYDGVLIPGSHYSAYDDLPWVRCRCCLARQLLPPSHPPASFSSTQIHRLKDYIRACYIPLAANHNAPEHRLKPQIVGSCFGCQVRS